MRWIIQNFGKNDENRPENSKRKFSKNVTFEKDLVFLFKKTNKISFENVGSDLTTAKEIKIRREFYSKHF